MLCLGLTQLNSDLTSGNGFRDDVDSVEGQELVEQSFPAGANAPTNIVVTDDAKLDAVREAVAHGARASPSSARARSRARPARSSRRPSTRTRSAPPAST